MGSYDDISSEIELLTFLTKENNENMESKNTNVIPAKPGSLENGLSSDPVPADQVGLLCHYTHSEMPLFLLLVEFRFLAPLQKQSP